MSKKARTEIAECVEEFNSLVRIITEQAYVLSDENMTIYRMRNQVIIAINECPCIAIDQVGRYLFKYREALSAANDDFFIEKTYEDDISENKESNTIKTVRNVIPIIKQCIMLSSPDERKKYRAYANDMLDWYIKYKIAILEEANRNA